MTAQLPLDLAARRRIDITLERLEEAVEALTAEERAAIHGHRLWSLFVLMSRVRSMEMAEEAVLGKPCPGLADIYDRVVEPGEPLAAALLRTFQAAYGTGPLEPREFTS